jgi:pimeloyl-ACP methyl ester carboxylesterase
MCAVLLLALAISAPALAAGMVEDVTYYSDALGRDMPVQIYLPDGYESSGNEYPTLYFLTDTVGTAAMTVIASHLDGMIGAGLIDPMIVVAIDGTCTPFADWGAPIPMSSWWRNSELNGPWKDALVADLVTWIDTASGYRTLADPGHRFLAGHFFGGGAAMLTALEHPAVFGSVVASAGNGTLEVYQSMLPYMLAAEYPGGPPYTYNPGAGPLSFQNFMLAAAFTPNVTATPWPIDFWLDSSGNLVPDVWQRFIDQTSPSLATSLAATGLPLDIYFDCDSEGMTAPACALLHSTLEDLGLPHVTAGFTGQTFADRMPIYLTFFMPLNATLELSPRTLNGNDWWPLVEATVEFPGDLDVADIDTMTLAITQINGADLAKPLRALVASDISDVNGNGRNDLTVWFWKPCMLRMLSALGIEEGTPFDVTVEGETTDELFFAATDEQTAVNLKAARAMPFWPLWPVAAID